MKQLMPKVMTDILKKLLTMAETAYSKMIFELAQVEDDPSTAGTFGPTPKFYKIYGNYCGPGNRGGDPIDGLDAACMKHDKCYFANGRNNCDCDKDLLIDIDAFLKTDKLQFKQKTFASLIKLYFKKAKKC
jgi:hypothetical protein